MFASPECGTEPDRARQGRPQRPPSTTLAAALAVFADLKASREEAWLLERYPGYDEYRRQVSYKLIPCVY